MARSSAAQRLLPSPEAEGLEITEYFDIDDDPQMLRGEIDEDGSLIVDMGGEEEEEVDRGTGEFFENLADDVIPETELMRIATDLLMKIDEDKQAREKRDQQYEEGIRRTGLGNDAPGGATFEGASKVVHPGLTEACIDGEARLMKELWPPSGPVKPKILGEVTAEKQTKADRKTAYMNQQLTTTMKEAFDTVEKTLTQVMLGGSQFIKLWQDHRLGRPRMQFVPVDKVFLQASADSLQEAGRRTFVETITQVEYLQRVESGQYRKERIPPPAMDPEKTAAQKATDKVEGKEGTGQNIDGERDIYETMTYLEVSDEMADALEHEEQGKLYPYLMTIDASSKRVLALYRDWEQEDEAHEPIEHYFEFPMIPWRGAMSIGFCQIIGGLSGASTGALRALLDSAHIANVQGGYIKKGAGISGQNKKPMPGEMLEVDTGMETKDIRDVVMPFNTKEPSTVLFQLLGALVESSKGVVRTTLDEAPSDRPNPATPVGTQLSRVEEGLTVFSSIHGRTHTAFNRLLQGLHRLNRLYLPEVQRVDLEGKETLIMRRDFEGPSDVQPTSDPTIYSDRQRFEQIGAIQQRQIMLKGAGINMYNDREVERRFLKLIKVPDFESLLVAEPKPSELNSVNENVAMAFGRPVVVFANQDHLAHLQAHLDFAQSPALGGNPIIQQKFLPALLQHCAEHMVYHYVTIMNNFVSDAAGVPAAELYSQDDEVKNAFDQVLAMASMRLVPGISITFERALPLLQKGMQALQAMMPPPPMDPAQAAAKAAEAETQRRTADDASKAELAAKELERKGTKDQTDAALKDKQINTAASVQREKTAADMIKAREANQNKLTTTLITTDTDEEIAEGDRLTQEGIARGNRTAAEITAEGNRRASKDTAISVVKAKPKPAARKPGAKK